MERGFIITTLTPPKGVINAEAEAVWFGHVGRGLIDPALV